MTSEEYTGCHEVGHLIAYLKTLSKRNWKGLEIHLNDPSWRKDCCDWVHYDHDDKIRNKLIYPYVCGAGVMFCYYVFENKTVTYNTNRYGKYGGFWDWEMDYYGIKSWCKFRKIKVRELDELLSDMPKFTKSDIDFMNEVLERFKQLDVVCLKYENLKDLFKKYY